MLGLMAKNPQFQTIGNILLTLGLLGYISGNTYLAYIGLIGALIFFTRQLIEMHLAKKKKSEDTIITI
jgi:hypothetical protein